MKEFNLNEYLKNPSRKVVTRDGREVRIICTDFKRIQPIIALIAKNQNEEVIHLFNKNGRWSNTKENCLDLFFAPIKREGWVNIYKMGIKEKCQCGNIFETEKEALNFKGDKNYIATIKIEWEE